MAIPSTSELADAWSGLASGLDRLGRELDADGVRHLGALVQQALRWFVDADDPDFPRMVNLNDTFELADNRFAAVRSDATYVLRGDVSTLTEVNVSLHEGWGFLGQVGVWGDLGLDDLDVAADGSFELVLGEGGLPIPTEATMLQVREYYGDWGADAPGTFELVRRGSEGAAPPRATPAEVAARLDRVLPWIEGYLRAHGGMVARLRSASANEIAAPTNQLGGNRNIHYGFGRFELDEGQALVLELPDPKARLWGVQWLTDPWYENPDLANRATSVPGGDASVSSDGMVRIVVSATDPRVPNWLDVAGYDAGVLVARFLWCDDPGTLLSRVVPVGRLGDELPADTPTVSPAQRRAEQSRRRAHFAARRR